MTRRVRTRSAPRAAGQRGYTLPVVIGVLFLATILISATLKLIDRRSRIINAQIELYHRHHEQFGVRDIVRNAFIRDIQSQQLPEFDASGLPAFETVLPDGTLISIFARDAQGPVLANLNAVRDDPAAQDLMRTLLLRLPENRPDLIRSAGPQRMSVRSMPDEVIEAVAQNNEDLRAALYDVRGDTTLTRSNLAIRLNEAGVDIAEAQDVIALLETEPELWWFLIEVADPGTWENGQAGSPGSTLAGLRRYVVLAQFPRGALPQMYEWRAATADDAADFGRGPAGLGGPVGPLR